MVGTHQLLQESVTFHDLGLIIVDEEHDEESERRALLATNWCLFCRV